MGIVVCLFDDVLFHDFSKVIFIYYFLKHCKVRPGLTSWTHWWTCDWFCISSDCCEPMLAFYRFFSTNNCRAAPLSRESKCNREIRNINITIHSPCGLICIQFGNLFTKLALSKQSSPEPDYRKYCHSCQASNFVWHWLSGYCLGFSTCRG